MKSKKISFEYLSGLIDGEGCLYVSKYGKSETYAIRVDVGMSNKAHPLLYALKKQFGGSVNVCRKETAKWDGSMKWSIQGKQCAVMLENCIDYMILKENQAGLLLWLDQYLDLCDRHKNGNIKWDAQIRAFSESIKDKVNLLNAKGPSGGGSSKGD